MIVFKVILKLLNEYTYIYNFLAHKDLFVKANLIHRDISVWNLMFVVNPDDLSDPSIRRGLLIDLEYASDEDLDVEGNGIEAAEAWTLIQRFDSINLDFVQHLNFDRIRGLRTVIFFKQISSLFLQICCREPDLLWHGKYSENQI